MTSFQDELPFGTAHKNNVPANGTRRPKKHAPEHTQDNSAPVPAPAEVEGPYELPEGWKWVRLGEVAEINPARPKMSHPDSLECHFIPMSHVDDITGRIIKKEIKPYGDVKQGYTYFQNEDVLFAKITPCMENGKAAIATELLHGFGYGSTEFFVLRMKGVCENRLIYHYVRWKVFREAARASMSGAVGQQRVPKHFLENYLFPLPPLAEQKRIADKLDRLMADLRRAKELIDEARATFSTRRSAILAQAFTGALTADWRSAHPGTEPAKALLERIRTEQPAQGKQKLLPEDREPAEGPYELPEGWEWVRLGEVIVSYDNDRIPVSLAERTKRKGQYPYYGASGIIDQIDDFTHDGRFLLIGEDGANLLTRSKPIAFLATGKIWVNNHAHVIKAVDDFSSNEWLSFYINSIDLTNYVTGSAQPKLTQKNLNILPVPLPPLAEQQEIVRRLESLFAKEGEAAELLEMGEHIELVEKSILSRAFRGEL